MKKIYVLGSLNTDLSIETNQLPLKGQTLTGSNFRSGAGGKGLNQAIAAAKLGADVQMLGAIGNDSFGEMMLNSLIQNGVHTENIKIRKNCSSGIAVIILSHGDNRIILDLGANLTIDINEIDHFLLQANEGDIFLTQLENNLDSVGYALQVAKKKKMVTVLNPAPANINIEKYLGFVDIFTPNEGELHGFLKSQNIHEFLDKYKEMTIIETRGKDGYKVYSRNTEFSGKAKEVKVVDTTGAGDTFNGALCYMLSYGKKIDQETLDFACLAASISTTKKGSSISSPTLKDIKQFKN